MLLYTFLLNYYLTSNGFANSSAIEGGVINFQGLLVNEKGVPYGTNNPETFIMRFSITSEDNNFIPWIGNPIEVEVIDGLFSVRLGKFDENVDALDSTVLQGMMIRAEEDFFTWKSAHQAILETVHLIIQESIVDFFKGF